LPRCAASPSIAPQFGIDGYQPIFSTHFHAMASIKDDSHFRSFARATKVNYGFSHFSCISVAQLGHFEV